MNELQIALLILASSERQGTSVGNVLVEFDGKTYGYANGQIVHETAMIPWGDRKLYDSNGVEATDYSHLFEAKNL